MLAMPPAADPKGLTQAAACADHGCLRVVPRVLTSGATKPDFSALKDKIAWLHIYNKEEHGPRDFAVALDPAGPVYVAMRAHEIKSNKKGFGLAKWTESGGATFLFLPAPLDASKEGYPTEIVAAKGKVSLIFKTAKERVLLEHDGKSWTQRPFGDDESLKSPLPASATKPRFYRGARRFGRVDPPHRWRVPDGAPRGGAVPHGVVRLSASVAATSDR